MIFMAFCGVFGVLGVSGVFVFCCWWFLVFLRLQSLFYWRLLPVSDVLFLGVFGIFRFCVLAISCVLGVLCF